MNRNPEGNHNSPIQRFFAYEAEQLKGIVQRWHSHLQVWKKWKGPTLDDAFEQAHRRVFREIDCLHCANCCKTTSPIVTRRDVQSLSRKLRTTGRSFYEQYLRTDEDGDWVWKNQGPCPFLKEDNRCGVYESRPEACRDYPHTQRRKMHLYLDLSAQNARICPAILPIWERVEQLMKSKKET